MLHAAYRRTRAQPWTGAAAAGWGMDGVGGEACSCCTSRGTARVKKPRSCDAPIICPPARARP
jgi:hypothetical protein